MKKRFSGKPQRFMQDMVRPAVTDMEYIVASAGGGNEMYFFADKASIAPQIVTSGGPTPEWSVTEADSTVYYYSGGTCSHTRTVAGAMKVTLLNFGSLADKITAVYFNAQGITGDLVTMRIAEMTSLSVLRLFLNSNLTGNFGALRLPDTVTDVRVQSCNLYGNMEGYQFPSGLVHFYADNNDLSGDISGWTSFPSTMYTLSVHHNASLTGNLESWTIPPALIYLYLNSCNFTGDLAANWARLPSTLKHLWMHFNSFSSGPLTCDTTSDLFQYYAASNGLSEAAVDAICQDLYENRNVITNPSPGMDVSGTNAPPSGVYQDGDPPTTGKEYIYEIANDPEAEGFPTWAFNYST